MLFLQYLLYSIHLQRKLTFYSDLHYIAHTNTPIYTNHMSLIINVMLLILITIPLLQKHKRVSQSHGRGPTW